jgi:ABC-type amino acid transport substrate-binding protein
MKNIIVIAFLLFSGIIFSQTTTLKLASDVWPPFTDMEGEKAFAMDLVKEALVRTGVKVEFDVLDFDDVMSGIDQKKFDGSAALWISDERAAKYHFSDAYLQNQLILVGKKGSDVSAETFDDFNGVRIGVVEDYSYGANINSDKVKLIQGVSDQQNLERLLSGEIDYMLVDDLLIQYMLKYQVNDVREFLEIADYPILVKSLHFAIRKDVENAEKIIADFNAEIKEMIGDGTYNKILELNWVRADMDGDGTMELIMVGDAAGTAPPEHPYAVNQNPSMMMKSATPEKYYINGKFYNSWDQVPDSFKTEIVMSTQDPKDTGIKLNF